jgi:glycosyl hydrolase family 31
MKRRFALPFLLCCSGLAAADPPALQIAGRPVQLSLTAISAHTVQITVAPLDLYRTPQPVPDDPVLVSRVWPAPAFRLRSVLPAETVRVGGMQVTVTPESLKLSFARSSGGQFQQIAIDPKDGSVSFHIGSEPLFGLGEGGPQFDRHGLYPGNDLNGSPHNPAVFIDHLRIPLVIGSSGWAIFARTPSGTFDLRGVEGLFRGAEGQPALPLDLSVMAADQPALLLAEYAGLTGFPSLPPLWALGYQQSHRVLLSQERMLAIARRLRDDKLPCDVSFTWEPGLPRWAGTWAMARLNSTRPSSRIRKRISRS